MARCFTFFIAVASIATATGAEPRTIRLWEADAPGAPGAAHVYTPAPADLQAPH